MNTAGSVEWLLARRWWVLCLVLVATVASIGAFRSVAMDAIPDIADPQIIVYAKWQRSPQLIEAEVVSPLVKSLLGTAQIATIRSTSHMGYAFVYVILHRADDRERVRQLLQQRIADLRPRLPTDVSLSLGPDAGSTGWIFQYALVDKKGERDLRELRLLNDNVVKHALQGVSGVAEVASIGGLEKQYQLRLFPPLLAATGITLQQVSDSVRAAFGEVGGRTIEVTNRDYQLRGSLNEKGLEELEDLLLGRDVAGKPVRVRDVGYLQVGYDLRRSIADLDGAGEVVGGIVVMAQDRNVLEVTKSLKERLRGLDATLPDGVDVITTYDRSDLIRRTLRNFGETLLYELLVVIAIVAVFLRNVRIALAPICVLLLSTLFTVLPMAGLDQTINLLSLAGLAIAIGEMIDATIVIVENCTAELARRRPETAAERRQVLVTAISDVARPLVFSLLIILASFLPLFFLGEREGRLFDPLVFAKTFALALSTVLTLVLLPILVLSVYNPRRIRPAVATMAVGARVYAATLRWVIRWRYATVGAALICSIAAVFLFAGFRKDYMPEVEEGSLLYMPTTLPGLPAREAGWILQQMDRRLKAIPEVERVFGKLGRADTATDAAPVTMIETTILLKPRREWRPGMTKDQLVALMNDEMQFVGFANSWTQPINARVLMQQTGIQTAVGLKVSGADLAQIESIAQQVETLLREVPGTSAVIAERIAQGYFVDVQYDLARLAAQGVTTTEASNSVQYAIGGDNVLSVRQRDGGLAPISVSYANEYTDSLEKLRNLPVITAAGDSVRLRDVADVEVRKLPEMIRSDDGALTGYVYVYLNNVTGPDYVPRARAVLENRLQLPAGYAVEWTGVYKYAEEARERLVYVVPLTLLIIFALLLVAFRSWVDSLIIMASVPFALVGGILLQWILDYPLTTAVAIGYVALFAVAIQTGIIMVIFIRQAIQRRAGGDGYVDWVIEGSVARLRPKLMTVAATVLSLLPVMFSSGQGTEIMKPIAAPTVGGMLTSTLFVLFLIPALYAIREDFRRKAVSAVTSAPTQTDG